MFSYQIRHSSEICQLLHNNNKVPILRSFLTDTVKNMNFTVWVEEEFSERRPSNSFALTDLIMNLPVGGRSLQRWEDKFGQGGLD